MTEVDNVIVDTHSDTMSTMVLARFFRRVETDAKKVEQQVATEALGHFTASADHKKPCRE
jgi:hypothetical protein